MHSWEESACGDFIQLICTAYTIPLLLHAGSVVNATLAIANIRKLFEDAG